jgi:hypothetical protein
MSSGGGPAGFGAGGGAEATVGRVRNVAWLEKRSGTEPADGEADVVLASSSGSPTRPIRTRWSRDKGSDEIRSPLGATLACMRIADLKPGWQVVTNDGHRLGRVKEVGQHFVEVAGGRFSPSLYVPSSAIGNVENETIHLNLADREVDATGWQQPPRTSDDLRTTRQRDADRDI